VEEKGEKWRQQQQQQQHQKIIRKLPLKTLRRDHYRVRNNGSERVLLGFLRS